jgi:hypothetical protein
MRGTKRMGKNHIANTFVKRDILLQRGLQKLARSLQREKNGFPK